jgi:E3 ubiquitin-protein ligase BRE1
VARARTRELGRENRRLQDLATQLQEKHHRISLEVGVGHLGWN